MRFEKLRIFVAISLILAILVVGNVIAFGKLIKDDEDDDNSQLRLMAPVVYNKEQVVVTKPTTASPTQPTPVAPSQTTTVTHTTKRTRAS